MSRANARARIETDAGSEIQCAKCGEFWPEEPEFYFFSKAAGAHSWCKACYKENPKIVAKTQRAIDKIGARRAAARGATV
jgi:hypothetical protein